MSFFARIKEFNKFYGMACNDTPTINPNGVHVLTQAKNFRKILQKEIDELDENIVKMVAGATDLEILTDMADFCGDVIVYSASEMAKYGLPAEQILDVIMDSNFSKMGADGKSIVDEDNKVQKGPNYWKPEPKIATLLAGRIAGHNLVSMAKMEQKHLEYLQARKEADQVLKDTLGGMPIPDDLDAALPPLSEEVIEKLKPMFKAAFDNLAVKG